jgi:hypothetical protein
MALFQTYGLQQVSDVGSSTTSNLSIISNSNGFLFGTTGQSKIKYDGTNLIIDPKISGSGYIDSNGANANIQHLSLGDSTPATATVLSMDETGSTTTAGISSTITYSGSGSTMRAMIFEAFYSGSNSGPTVAGGNFTGTLSADPSGTRLVFGVNGVANIDTGTVVTRGTTNIQNRFSVTGDTSGHTGGTINARSVHALEPTQFTGGVTANLWAIQATGDCQISSDKQWILEGGAATKGNSYFVFNSASTDIDCFVDGTNVQTWDNDQTDIHVDLGIDDANDIILGTSTGTKIGTAITQKMGFYNATPIAQRAGAAQAAVATTGATQTTPWGYTTAAQANAIVTLVNELRAWAVAQGFIKGAA